MGEDKTEQKLSSGHILRLCGSSLSRTDLILITMIRQIGATLMRSWSATAHAIHRYAPRREEKLPEDLLPTDFFSKLYVAEAATFRASTDANTDSQTGETIDIVPQDRSSTWMQCFIPD